MERSNIRCVKVNRDFKLAL